MTKEFDPITLHVALDAYTEQIGNKGGLSASASLEKRRSIIRRLKQHHKDIPLSQLDLDQCVAMIDLWRSRPSSARTGRPMAASTARTTLSELIRFFGRLDTSEPFAWKAPTYFGQISRGRAEVAERLRGGGTRKLAGPRHLLVRQSNSPAHRV